MVKKKADSEDIDGYVVVKKDDVVMDDTAASKSNAGEEAKATAATEEKNTSAGEVGESTKPKKSRPRRKSKKTGASGAVDGEVEAAPEDQAASLKTRKDNKEAEVKEEEKAPATSSKKSKRKKKPSVAPESIPDEDARFIDAGNPNHAPPPSAESKKETTSATKHEPKPKESKAEGKGKEKKQAVKDQQKQKKAEKDAKRRKEHQKKQEAKKDQEMMEEKKAREKGSKSRGRSKEEKIEYEEYRERDQVLRSLETGDLVQGKLRINAQVRSEDAYVTVNGLSIDVYIKGMRLRNRAMNGDLVAVELLDRKDWPIVRSTAPKDNKESTSAGSNDSSVSKALWRPDVDIAKRLGTSAKSTDDSFKKKLREIDAFASKEGKRPVGKVVAIVTPGNTLGYVGNLEPKSPLKNDKESLPTDDDYAFFNAHDNRLPRRIRIPRLQLPDAFVKSPQKYARNMLCFCRIKSWSVNHMSPMGEFVKTIGEFTGIESGISAALTRQGLMDHTLEFRQEIQNSLAARFGNDWVVDEEECKSRRDFRTSVKIFSIDPASARDLDDALHIRPLNSAETQFEVGVHIADVTHFVSPGSSLDEEAKKRATSVYLPNRVLPMLPRLLCERLCSLQPDVDRYAFSVVWHMNKDGTLVEGTAPWFGKSVIRSCCKLDYDSAQMMLDGRVTPDKMDSWDVERRTSDPATDLEVIKGVRRLGRVARGRRDMRFKAGALSLNDVKLTFRLDDKGNPVSFGTYEIKESNNLIEEFMLCANYLVAQRLLKAVGSAAFLRNHQPPLERGMDQVITLLGENGIDIDESSTRTLTTSLERVREKQGEDTFAIVQSMLTRPMKPAEYLVAGDVNSPETLRHYALNIPYYTHFTSPIRRYADVVVHRLLQSSLMEEEVGDSPSDLTDVAKNCNDKNRASKDAETACDEVFLSAYIRQHGDLQVTGAVVGVGQQSFTLYMMEVGLERRIQVKDLGISKKKWDEDEKKLTLTWMKKKGKNRKSKEEDEESREVTVDVAFFVKLRVRMTVTKKMPLALRFVLEDEQDLV